MNPINIPNVGVPSLAVLTSPLIADFIASDAGAKQSAAGIKMVQYRVAGYTDARVGAVRSVEIAQQSLIDAITREIPRSPADAVVLTKWRGALVAAMSTGSALPPVPATIAAAESFRNFAASLASDRADLAKIDADLATCWDQQRDMLTKLVRRSGLPLDVANTVQQPQPQPPIVKEPTPVAALTSGITAPQPGTPTPNPAPRINPAAPTPAARAAAAELARKHGLTASEEKRLVSLCADPAAATRLGTMTSREVLVFAGSPVPA